MLDEHRQGLVAAMVDVDQHAVRVVALVGARALVLGDRLGPPGSIGQAPAKRRAEPRHKKAAAIARTATAFDYFGMEA
jgi:hypothetical protein